MSDMKAYYPDRWDHHPDDKVCKASIAFRLANNGDIPQIRRFLRRYGNKTASLRAIQRWISYTGWTLWLAVRNEYTIVGLLATRHGPELNEVLRFGVAPSPLVGVKTLYKLLLLASYELPEVPIEITVRDDDLSTQTMLRSAGMVATRPADAPEHHVFAHPPAVKVGAQHVPVAVPSNRPENP